MFPNDFSQGKISGHLECWLHCYLYVLGGFQQCSFGLQLYVLFCECQDISSDIFWLHSRQTIFSFHGFPPN
jgi:hypothetical protein